jgi:hypothetical protein
MKQLEARVFFSGPNSEDRIPGQLQRAFDAQAARIAELEAACEAAWDLLMCLHPRDAGGDATVKQARARLRAVLEHKEAGR